MPFFVDARSRSFVNPLRLNATIEQMSDTTTQSTDKILAEIVDSVKIPQSPDINNKKSIKTVKKENKTTNKNTKTKKN